MQLSAQLHFRLDQGQACADAYDKLRSAGQATRLEQKANYLAAYVSAGLAAKVPELMSKLGLKPRDSYEVGFNRACAVADVGEYDAAETAVKAAYKVGKCGLVGVLLTFDIFLGGCEYCCALLNIVWQYMYTGPTSSNVHPG